MNIFTQNDKMKKFGIHAFGLEPRKTCVKCKCPCYGEKGMYKVFGKTCKARWSRLLGMSRHFSFVTKIIEKIEKSSTIKIIRIHDTGDFYNQEYLDKWAVIAWSLPQIKFYCYTKALHLDFSNFDALPNTNRIQSEGGEHDNLIDKRLPIAIVLKPGEDKYIADRWHIGNDDEMPAVNGYRFIALKQH